MSRSEHRMILPLRMCFLALWCILYHAPRASAQVDTLQLGPVEISAEAFVREAAGLYLEKIKVETAPFSPGQNIAELLGSRSNNILLGYGPGGSFGLSLRGGSSAQTQVMLDGIPFEHPGLSQADLSLLPAVLFSDAAVYRGSSGALLGNASVGGTLFLDSRSDHQAPVFSQDFIVGSFGQRAAATHSSYGDDRFSGRTAVYWQEARNDFYRPDPSDPDIMTPQPNAFFRTRGIRQDLAYRMNRLGNFDASVWYASTERQIPPSLSQAASAAKQDDENLRVQVGLLSHIGLLSLHFKTALDRGNLRFTDHIANIDDPSDFTTFHTQVQATVHRDRWQWSGMAIYRNSTVAGAHINAGETRESPAIVAKVQRTYGNQGSRISAAVRAEWLNGHLLPALPTVGITHVYKPGIAFRASAGRVYRLPGLNDLYWNPGGNPDLRPESGWSQELGVDIHSKEGKPFWKVSVTVFNRNIEDWIVWLPAAGLWEPQNLRKVWSRGGEISLAASQKVGAFRLEHRAESSVVRSTQLKAEGVPAHAEGKQLAYIPVWSNFLSERVNWRNIFLIGTIRHQSLRYTNTDNSRHLDAFFTADIEMSIEKKFRKWTIGASLAVRNLTDQAFQIQANRPMPGRHFSAGFNFTIL